MFYVVLFVSVGLLTLVLLGALTYRLWRQVRQFGREVAAAGERISRAGDELGHVGPPASSR